MAQKTNNYITNMIRQFGENWIVALRPEDIQRSGKRIFKEMVRGLFDYQQVGNYFLDAKFLDNLIISCSNELEINRLLYNALVFYQQNFPTIPNIYPQIKHLESLCYVYSVIYSRLTTLKSSTDISCLFDISALLYTYRNHLN